MSSSLLTVKTIRLSDAFTATRKKCLFFADTFVEKLME